MVEQVVTLGGRGRQVQFTLDLDPNDYQDSFLHYHFSNGSCYEPEIAWVMFRTVRRGDVVLDIGANVGFFTMFLSALVGDEGKVIACEPGANTLPKLKRHLRDNKIANVEIVEQPVWCRSEPVTFYLNADNSGGNALFDPANWWGNEKSRANPQSFTMQATTVDDLDALFVPDTIRLIKIDTEGAEQKILEGATTVLGRHPPYIICEVNPHGLVQSGCDEFTLREYMRGFGYEAFVLFQDGALPALIPHKVRINGGGSVQISNILFSTLDDVAAAWPELIDG